MVLPRSPVPRGCIRSFALRKAGTQARASLRGVSRRTYASGHGPQQKSSDLPWLIGSVVVTVPAAAWLWQQGPEPSDDHHGHESHDTHKKDEPEKAPKEEPKEEPPEEPKEESETTQEAVEEKEDEKESKDNSKEEASDEGANKEGTETSEKE
ncbi:uncharacterized protein Z518_03256 [Rhinocladiella mackenziei CBS 650.93]|uniref:Uncharacterized protein n=1 Tax=Rhinocladiella mackenziei CBS 650.93 TaxID=1442369 RepID=A0A0D2JGY4_9EURO|nr:uncharacterized protein Z518_03256 [Rhinocladiella mackenziei CBS 650.93]KIX08600.1 hypothetical protein Z518_03256 [Rhinocladiella mackenziei CBS 650.93]